MLSELRRFGLVDARRRRAEISVQSEIGRGTTFTFDLPVTG